MDVSNISGFMVYFSILVPLLSVGSMCSQIVAINVEY